MRKEIMDQEPPDEIRCPRCGSTQVHPEKRGWDLSLGLLAGVVGLAAGGLRRNEIRLTCLKCGYNFRPGETIASPRKSELFKVAFVIVIILLVIAFFA